MVTSLVALGLWVVAGCRPIPGAVPDASLALRTERIGVADGRTRIVVLKADDLVASAAFTDGFTDDWNSYVHEVESRGLQGSVGIIADSLSANHPAYLARLNAMRISGSWELWMHGFDHAGDASARLYEFGGRPVDYQTAHFSMAITNFQDALGFRPRAFGAPWNETDFITTDIVNAQNDIDVWMFPHCFSSMPPCSISPQTFVITTEYKSVAVDFMDVAGAYSTYSRAKSAGAAVTYQLHPKMAGGNLMYWSEFGSLLDLLTADGAIFVTPSGLAELSRQRQ